MRLRRLSKFVILFLLFGLVSFASAEEYDGVWFLGFNFNKSFCADLNFRQAVASTISIKNPPVSIVPSGMVGYENNAQITTPNVQGKSKFQIPKRVVLLHTDGVKTVEIAKQIKKDLSKIGIKVKFEQIDYAIDGMWEEALASGKYHLFLMGYKADDGDLLTPLFSKKGEANFCNFKSSRFEKLLKQKKYKEANRFLVKNQVIVPLFYITKL